MEPGNPVVGIGNTEKDAMDNYRKNEAAFLGKMSVHEMSTSVGKLYGNMEEGYKYIQYYTFAPTKENNLNPINDGQGGEVGKVNLFTSGIGKEVSAAESPHQLLQYAINTELESTVNQARNLLYRITNMPSDAMEKSGGNFDPGPELSLKSVLDDSPEVITSKCRDLNQLLADIDAALFRHT